MTNFIQKCYIAKDFETKKPKLAIRTNKSGQSRLMGRLKWKDGKKEDGTDKYTSFNFSTSNPEIINLIERSADKLFEIKGFLKNESWKDDFGKWRNYQEIYVISAEVFEKKSVDQKPLNGHVEDDEIPF